MGQFPYLQYSLRRLLFVPVSARHRHQQLDRSLVADSVKPKQTMKRISALTKFTLSNLSTRSSNF